MSSLGLVADRWRVVTNAAGDACVLGSGGHAEVFLVEDEGRRLKGDGALTAAAAEEGDTGVVVGGGGQPLLRPKKKKKKKKKKKRYALKIDKRPSAGCVVGTVRHEIGVIRSLEGVPGVVRLAPELEEEEEEEEQEEEEEEEERDEKDDDGDPDDERRSKKRRRREEGRRRRRSSSSTVSGTLKDGRSWVVMELLGANLAEASVAAGAVAPRSSRRRSRAAAAAEEEAGAAEKGDAGGGGGGRGSSGSGSGCSWTAEDVRSAASSMLAALAAMHAAGWVHRDVKPANFALAPPPLPEEEEEEEEEDEEEEEEEQGAAAGDADGGKGDDDEQERNGAKNGGGSSNSRKAGNPSRRWVALDFGLSTRFLDASGNVLPPRPPEKRKSSTFPSPSLLSSASASAAAENIESGAVLFRGSTTYASPAAHSGRDASRRDDLWSWLYSVSELVVGTLPWRRRGGERGGGGGGGSGRGGGVPPSEGGGHRQYSSLEEDKAAAKERASAGKRAVAADPGALMAVEAGPVAAAEGCRAPKTPGVVGGCGSEQQQQQTLSSSSQPPPPPPSHPACPPALARAARHVASLGFKDAPDYALLAQCAAELPGPMRLWRGRKEEEEGEGGGSG